MSSLKFVLGRCGSGKSEYIFNDAINTHAQGKNAIIIVPEQCSHESEFEMIKKTGYICESLYVTSFNRLSSRLIADSGIKRNRMDSSAKAMLLARALSKCRTKLNYFKDAEEKTGHIDLFLDAISEFKKGQVMPETVMKASEEAKDMRTSLRLSDIATVYDEYNKLISEDMSDGDDDITLCASLCFGNEYIKNSVIYIDEFFRFTKNEIFCIESFLSAGADVVVSLCTDENEDGIFETVKQTKKTLENTAKTSGADILPPEIMKKTVRFVSKELDILERSMAGEKITYDGKTEDLSLSAFKNRYDEVLSVASKIKKLVKNGMEYKDIAVVAGDYEGYKDIIKTTFDLSEIPVFIDTKRKFLDHPIVVFLFSVFDLLSGFTTDRILSYMKTGFSDITVEEASKLENYVLSSAINYNDWLDDERFLKKSRSIFAEVEDSGEEGLRQIEVKNRLLAPILALKEKISLSKCVKDRVEAMTDFFTDTCLSEKITQKADEFEKSGKLNLSDEYKEVYNIVTETLDTLKTCLGNENAGINVLREILTAGFSKRSIGIIPKIYDSVSYGDINRSVIKNAKALFLIGVNEGMFPNVPVTTGILSNDEREYLISRGISVAPDSKKLIEDAEFLLYSNVNVAKEKISFSYSLDNDGTGLRPAGFIAKLKRTFPELKKEAYLKEDLLPAEVFVSSKGTAYSYILTHIKEVETDKLAQRLIKELSRDEEYKEKIERAIKFSKHENTAGKLSPEAVASLYGNKLYGSVSRFERFSACPFSFFIEYGLRARERKVLKVEAPDIGSLLHEVVEKFFRVARDRGLNFKTISQEEQREISDEIIEEMFSVMMVRKVFSAGRINALKTRLKSLVSKSLWAICEHIVRGEFEPTAFELSFDKNGDIEPVKVTLPTGEEITMIGRIDRIDTFSDSGKLYIKIIDYKSGNKGYSLADIFNMTTLQLSVYMIAATENAKGKLGAGETSFGGMFYFKLDDPLEETLPGDEKDAEKSLKAFKMSGVLNSDGTVISAMDKTLTTGGSMIIPVYKLTDGSISRARSKIADKEQYEKLKRYVKNAVSAIGKEILSGNVDIKPIKDGNSSPCVYCKYRSVCGFDAETHKYRYAKKFSSDDEIWEEM